MTSHCVFILRSLFKASKRKVCKKYLTCLPGVNEVIWSLGK